MLLDSEGIDSTTSESFDDHQIFTLTVLLASVLIYNSQGVPTRNDVEKLEYLFPCILCIRQQIETNPKHNVSHNTEGQCVTNVGNIWSSCSGQWFEHVYYALSMGGERFRFLRQKTF